jgi:thiamine transport system substrate-binding protein
MKRRILSRLALAAVISTTGFLHLNTWAAAPVLRVMVHDSFDLPKPLLAQFEKDAGVKLSLIKGGDAGEMLNKLILTKSKPVADVVYGIDNTLAAKASAAGVLAPSQAAAGPLGVALTAVDYGYVTLNFDKAALAKKGVALPQSLQDLTQPAYKKWLVVENPATSSPGFAFLLATIAGMGEEQAFDWWGRMRANGLKVSKGWTEAYYTHFSRNGGAYPLVVSYASSPAAEVFYSKEKLTESPTGNLFLKGGVYRQMEGVGLIAGGKQPEAAQKFVAFMTSVPVQEALQTTMWMFPTQAGVARAEVMRHAPEPASFDSLPSEQITEKSAQWIARWTKVVLK